MLHINLITVSGLAVILTGVLYMIIPPKYNSSWYGIKTPITTKSEEVWNYGHKLFAIGFFILGAVLIVMGLTPLKKMLLKVMGALLIVVFWQVSKYIVHKMILKKYPNS